MQPALLFTPTLVTATTFCLLTLGEDDENGESEGTVKSQVLSSQSDDPSSEESWLEKVEAPSSILERPSHRKEPALISFSVEPAEDFVHSESEGMYLPARVDRLSLFERTACIIIINACSTCC